jgi:outer membrane lipoprotein SlyB
MRPAIFVVIGLVLAGCTTSNSNTYSADDIGVPMDTNQATVVSSRVVEIKGDPGPIGPLAGGAAGATIAGVSIGSGSGSTIAAVLGGLLGAGAGYFAERQMSSGEGIEYVLETDDGRTITLVQNREPEEEPIPDGTPVLVQVGSRYSRVLPHPSADADAPSNDWVNPDADLSAPMSPDRGYTVPGTPDQTTLEADYPRGQQQQQ